MVSPNYISETHILRRIANDPDCRWIFTHHAKVEMAKDRRTAPDIQHALMNGHVTLQEFKKDRLWRIEGRDLDGKRVQVVAAVYEDAIAIKVVTSF